MKKGLFSCLFIVVSILVISCNGKSGKESGITVSASPAADSTTAAVSDGKSIAPSWVKEGTECYGILVGSFSDGTTLGKAVKCKVMSVKPDKVRMKTIESVNLLEGEGCNKMGIAYGDTWWEEEGDIFKTREEAEAYLKEKGWFRQ